jgi:alkylation response protein AidB-like acyl-CoA dehydrogenase
MIDRDKLRLEASEIGRKLKPLAESGEPGRVNRALVTALAQEGLPQRLLPQIGSGSNSISAMELCLVREALARESTMVENALTIQLLGALPIVMAGREEQIRAHVMPVVEGKAIAAFAITEPEVGTDAAALRLRADWDGAGYRLSGNKAFISNAPEADFYTLFARTSPETGSKGITAFIVDGAAKGLTGTALRIVSDHPIGRLELNDVVVGEANVLGEVNQGFKLAMRTLDLFRPSVGANALGMAQAALDAAIGYASERQAFGRPIKEFQAVSHQVAEMATRLEAARALVYSAAQGYDAGSEHVARRSAMAKLFATETAQQVIDAAIQVHGAVGLERGHLLEHLYREVRALRIYEGTSEIQREIIARDLFRQGQSSPTQGA